jgi:hypothetical protein
VLNRAALIRARRDADLRACADQIAVVYEPAGWTRAGQLTVRWTDHESAGSTSAGQNAARRPTERVLTEYVYLGPHPD